jgi:hypothetical protein
MLLAPIRHHRPSRRLKAVPLAGIRQRRNGDGTAPVEADERGIGQLPDFHYALDGGEADASVPAHVRQPAR